MGEQRRDRYSLPSSCETDAVHISSTCFAGKNVLFVSNNASKSRPMYKKTFDDFGIDTTDVSTKSKRFPLFYPGSPPS